MSPKFNRAAETLEQRRDRLETYGKILDESLRRPPSQKIVLTPSGQLKQGADRLAEQAVQQKRGDIAQDVELINKELKERERDNPQREQDKSMERSC